MVGETGIFGLTKRALLASTSIGLAAAGSLWGGAVAAQDSLPAVSGINGKIAIAGGVAHYDGYDANGISVPPFYSTNFLDSGSQGLGMLIGSVALPIGHAFGAQIDGVAGVEGSAFTGGLGGHLFWRDPEKGLIGLTGAGALNGRNFHEAGFNPNGQCCFYADWGIGERSVWRAGAEAEAYFDRITLHGTAGYQWTSAGDDGVYGAGGIDFYATDNFMIGAGGGSSGSTGNFATARLEIQTFENVSFFANVSGDFNGSYRGVAGVRFYFGGPKSLIDRHRRDDPVSNLVEDALAGIDGRTQLYGFSCCFTGETEILLADGTTRPISGIRTGDRVVGEHGEINTVVAIETPMLGCRKLYGFNGGSAFVTAEHPFMTRGGWKSIDPEATFAETGHFRVDVLGAGDEVVVLASVSTRALPMVANSGLSMPCRETVIETAYSAIVRIAGHEDDATRTVFNLRLDGNHTYFANGYLVHNK